MRRAFLGVLAAASVFALASDGRSHIQISEPAQRTTSQKDGPCGTVGNLRGSDVAVLEPGATIIVTWSETVDHPGHFRISFDADGTDDFVDPASFEDLYSAESVLVDDIADGNGGTYEQEITLPDVECDNCTLQLVQVMTDKPPYGDGNDLYYQCADLVLAEGAGGGATTSATTGAGGAGTTASSSANGSGAGSTAGAGAGNPDGPGSVGPGGSDGGEDEGGCSMTPGPSGLGGAALVALVAALATRRRRRTA